MIFFEKGLLLLKRNLFLFIGCFLVQGLLQASSQVETKLEGKEKEANNSTMKLLSIDLSKLSVSANNQDGSLTRNRNRNSDPVVLCVIHKDNASVSKNSTDNLKN